MEFSNKKSVFDNLSIYDILAKEDDIIELTEWTNGEGYDITIKDKVYSFTDGELDAILFLRQALQYKGK